MIVCLAHLAPVTSVQCSALIALLQCRFDPFWNSLVVAGMEGDKPFVGMVSMIGVSYTGAYICTGFANHLALPLIRDAHRPEMTEQEAVDVVQACLKVWLSCAVA